MTQTRRAKNKAQHKLEQDLQAALEIIQTCGNWWYASSGRVDNAKRERIRELILEMPDVS